MSLKEVAPESFVKFTRSTKIAVVLFWSSDSIVDRVIYEELNKTKPPPNASYGEFALHQHGWDIAALAGINVNPSFIFYLNGVLWVSHRGGMAMHATQATVRDLSRDMPTQKVDHRRA